MNVQNKLKALGYLDDIADGVFGENTEKAVKEFQKDNGLSETGEVDRITYRLLFADDLLNNSSESYHSDEIDSGDAVTTDAMTDESNGAERVYLHCQNAMLSRKSMAFFIGSSYRFSQCA